MEAYIDQRAALELLEQEERETASATAGLRRSQSRTTVSYGLECASLTQQRSRIGKLLSLDLAIWHTRRRITSDFVSIGDGESTAL